MQPEGLRESGRWSNPDVSGEDHRYRVIPTRTLKGCQIPSSLRTLSEFRNLFVKFPRANNSPTPSACSYGTISNTNGAARVNCRKSLFAGRAYTTFGWMES